MLSGTHGYHLEVRFFFFFSQDREEDGLSDSAWVSDTSKGQDISGYCNGFAVLFSIFKLLITHSEKYTGKIMNRFSFQSPRCNCKESTPFVVAKLDVPVLVMPVWPKTRNPTYILEDFILIIYSWSMRQNTACKFIFVLCRKFKIQAFKT